MKNKHFFLVLIFVISPFYIFSQENFQTSVIVPLQKNHLFREKVFIHLNKTIYFNEENIWFTGYVSIDQDNKPSEYTTNLHVNLLNSNGDVIDSKNIFIDNGVGFGDFLIKNNYPAGKYYIQGFTNYMQNFGDENVFIQEIELMNPSLKNLSEQKEYSNNYDVQVFPESGYLLEETENTIGIKALINGKWRPFSGKLMNSEGLEITSSKGNNFGMSKCSFTYLKNETYTAIVNFNGISKIIVFQKQLKLVSYLI